MKHQSVNRARWRIVAVLLVLTVATLACSVPSRTASLTIVNNSSQPICSLFFREPGSGAWGEDRLSSEGEIAPGESTTITEIAPASYDLRVETCDGNSAERVGENLDGEVEWTITD
jgi:hypothetical protein